MVELLLAFSEGRAVLGEISTDAVMRVVPFLSSIPNLDRVFLGGQFGGRTSIWYRMVYNASDCVAPREHQAVFKALVQSIVGGFKSRTLSQRLDVSGILGGEEAKEATQLECALRDERPDRPCQVCRAMFCLPSPSIYS